MRWSSGHQGLNDRAENARRRRDVWRHQRVLTLPPARRKLGFETPHAVEVVEDRETTCDRPRHSREHATDMYIPVDAAVSGHQRRAQRGETRATAFERVEYFDDEKIRSSVGRVLRTQNIFQVPAVTRRNRRRGQKAHESSRNVTGSEISFLFFMLKEIDGEEPLKPDCAASRRQPAFAKTGCFADEFVVNLDYFRHLHAGPARLIYTRARFLRAVAARSPRRQIEVRRSTDLDGSEAEFATLFCKLFGRRHEAHHATFSACFP